jgi:bromodomain-containing protein 9
LACFAAKLGPVAWVLAADRIRQALPPGTNFGPGWVVDGVDGELLQNSQHPPPVASTNPSSQLTAPPSDMTFKDDVLHHKPGLSSNGNVTGEGQSRTQTVASTSSGLDKSSEITSKIKYENGVNKSFGGMDNNNIGPAPPLHHHGQGGGDHSNINGFNAVPNTINQILGQGMFGSGTPMTHAQVLGMFSAVNGRTNGYINGHPVTAVNLKPAQNGDDAKTTANSVHDAGHDRKVSLPLNGDNCAPSLNAGVQSSDSLLRGKVANPKHPDLALQL